MSLWCKVGLHKWKKNRALLPIDSFPPPSMKYEKLTRHCTRPGCTTRQYWLSGFGGSELGSWQPTIRLKGE